MKLGYECGLRWKDLEGDNEVRRVCGVCDKSVYNVSGMTRAQFQRLLDLHQGTDLCVRFVTRNGRVVHDGDPFAQLDAQRRGARRLLAAALAAQTAFLAFSDNPRAAFYDPFGAAVGTIRQLMKPVTVQEREFTGANPAIVDQVVF